MGSDSAVINGQLILILTTVSELPPPLENVSSAADALPLIMKLLYDYIQMKTFIRISYSYAYTVLLRGGPVQRNQFYIR